ncbi:hypothetical protein N0543_32515, partial [Pseudomonas aeruginosa]|nr:hypothetical protein [Pseudomonas aeruginosa]
AEFVIGHGATPYRNGRVLHSVFAAAELDAARALSNKLLSDCATELAYPAKIYLTNTLAMISAEKGENARCLEYAHRVQKQIPVRDDGQPAEDLLPAEHAFAMEQRAKADALSERCSDEK